MSEISREANMSTEMDTSMDLFQYYIHGIRALITVDDFSPASLTHSRLVDLENGSFRSLELEKEGSGANEKNRSLFSNAAGNGLSGHRKERLAAMLCQSVAALSREVDQMLDPVFTMRQLRCLSASYSDAHGKVEPVERVHKRLKVDEPLNVSPASCVLTGEGSLSERKDAVEPGKRKSLPRCNNTECWNYAGKSNSDEIKSLCGDCSKQGMNESFLGSSSRDDKENGEVNDALEVLLENGGSKVEEMMEKHSAEISAMLERMKNQLEELVDIAVSTCRAMTQAEKHQLRKLIETLHPQNMDRIVKILQRGKPPEQQSRDDITVDLQNEDNVTLWRIYFHVKAVDSARKLL